MGNTFKTTLLLVALSLFMLFVGEMLGGRQGIMFALIFAALTNFIAYFFSDKIALSMNGAQPVTREELPRVYEVVERLTQKVGLPMPKIYVIPNESPNAFATGRNPDHSSVAVTQGILQLLTDEELEGVLAHELGHVRNRDILISTVAATLAAAITGLARMAYFAELFGYGGGSGDCQAHRAPHRRARRTAVLVAALTADFWLLATIPFSCPHPPSLHRPWRAARPGWSRNCARSSGDATTSSAWRWWPSSRAGIC